MNVGPAVVLLYQYGLAPALLVFVFYLIYVLLDEDLSALWRGRIYRGLYCISGKREAEKRYIANDINGRLNLARRKLHHGKTALPKAVRVEWVEGDGEGTYDIGENEFVVRLNPGSSQEGNIAKLAMAVLGRTTLIGIRHLVEEPLEQSIDLNLVRNLLQQVGDRKVLDWFFQNEYTPVTEQSAVAAWNQEIVEIDGRGLFTHLLLIELDAFAKRIAGMAPRPHMTGEIEQLVHFLFRIATKQYGQDVPLNFVRAYIAIGVILVAKTSKLLEEGIEPYVRCMNYKIEKGLNSVYVIVSDKELLRETDEEAHKQFVKRTKELERSILYSSLVTKDFATRFSCVDQFGNRRKAVCTRYLIQPQR